jgi:hypothetical protein
VNNLNLIRGLWLILISLAFGITALKYDVGQLARPGPGLFPLVISGFLFMIGLFSVVRSHFVEREAIRYNMKNIALILLGLCGFAVISEYINMILGIIFLVFVVGFAGTSYSVVRNIKITAGLIAVAFLFRNLLGLQLPLY